MSWRTTVAVFLLLAAVAAWWFLPTEKTSVTVVIDTPFYDPSIFDPSDIDAATFFLEAYPDTRITIKERYYTLEPEAGRSLFIEEQLNEVAFFVTTQPSQSLIASFDLFLDGQSLLINTSSTSLAATGRDDFVLRIIPDLQQEQMFIADYVASLEARCVLVLIDAANPAYTGPAYEHFSKALLAHGEYSIQGEEVEFRDVQQENFTRLFSQDIDLLYILAGDFQAGVGNVIQYFHSLHPETPIVLTPWAGSPAIYQTAGPAIAQVVLISHYDTRTADAALNAYLESFTARFGYQPHYMAIKIRQALELLHQALEQGYDSPQAVKDYLLSQPVHHTSLGDIRFDAHGDLLGGFHIITQFDREVP